MEKRWKEEIFTVLGEKNMIFEKRGEGKYIIYFDNIHPCFYIKHLYIVNKSIEHNYDYENKIQKNIIVKENLTVNYKNCPILWYLNIEI